MFNLIYRLLPVLLPWGTAVSQPFLDLMKMDHLRSPDLIDRTELNMTLPLKLDTSGRLLLLDPHFVEWRVTTDADRYQPAAVAPVREQMGAVVLPIGYITPLGRQGWRLATVPIIRYAWLESTNRGMVQMAGTLIFSRQVKPGLTWRYGVYISGEAFGLFVRPLLGVDWRISPRSNLFGVLPGTLNYEYKVNRWVHVGMSFLAYTSSYGTPNGDFRRVDENPVGVFADLYLTKRVVLRGEVGRSFMCQFRGGSQDPVKDDPAEPQARYLDHGLPEHFYFRLLLAFRMRLDDRP
ncbi:MAG: hypothetical protein JNM31_05160 [Flavobacteriales bacterium]|nr:hypothetical protein [Flavobacteriales bacterium]